jgi:hypothetical protein
MLLEDLSANSEIEKLVTGLYSYCNFLSNKYQHSKQSLTYCYNEYSYENCLVSVIRLISNIFCCICDGLLVNDCVLQEIFLLIKNTTNDILELTRMNIEKPLTFTPKSQLYINRTVLININDENHKAVHIKFKLNSLRFILDSQNYINNFFADILLKNEYDVVKINSIPETNQIYYIRRCFELLRNIFERLTADSLLLNIYSFINSRIRKDPNSFLTSFSFEATNTFEKTKNDLLSCIPEYVILIHSSIHDEGSGTMALSFDSKTIVINTFYCRGSSNLNTLSLLITLYHELAHLKRMNFSSTYIEETSPLDKVQLTDTTFKIDIGFLLEYLIFVYII